MKTYVLPELGYDYSALEPHLSAKTLELHHGKHHAAYVAGANEALEKIAAAREAGRFELLVPLQQALTFNVSGHVLHSLLWRNLRPHGAGRPEGELLAAIDENFGSLDSLRRVMTETALAVRGSGWCALAWEPAGGRLVVEQVQDHQGNIGNGTVPMLVLDVWEHAYYLQYQNRRPEWVAAFWKLVDWEDVGNRFRSVRSLDLLV